MNEKKQTAESYNGYTNYETWRVMAYIDNETKGEIYNHWLKIAGEIQDVDKLRELLCDSYAVDLNPNHSTGIKLTMFYGDLLDNALDSRVNWREIAAALIEDAAEANRANKPG